MTYKLEIPGGHVRVSSTYDKMYGTCDQSGLIKLIKATTDNMKLPYERGRERERHNNLITGICLQHNHVAFSTYAIRFVKSCLPSRGQNLSQIFQTCPCTFRHKQFVLYYSTKSANSGSYCCSASFSFICR